MITPIQKTGSPSSQSPTRVEPAMPPEECQATLLGETAKGTARVARIGDREVSVPHSGHDLNVTLKAWINLKVIAKLAAESCHFDGLALAQAADIYASRG